MATQEVVEAKLREIEVLGTRIIQSEDDLHTKDAEIGELNRLHLKLRQQVESLQRECESQVADNSGLRERIGRQTETLNEERRLNLQAQQNWEAESSRMMALIDETRRVHARELAFFDDKLRSSSAEIRDLKNASETAHLTIAELQTEIQQKSRALEEARQECAKLEAELQLSEQRSLKQLRVLAKFEESQKDLNLEIGRHQIAEAFLNQKSDRVERKHRESLNVVDRLSQELKILKEELHAARETYNQSLADKDETIYATQSQLEAAQRGIADRNERLSTLGKELENKESLLLEQLTQFECERSQAQSKYADQIYQLNEQLRVVQVQHLNEVTELNTQLQASNLTNAAKDARFESLTVELENRDARIAELRLELDAKHKSALAQMSELEAQRLAAQQDFQKSIEALNKSLSDSKSAHLNEVVQLSNTLQASRLSLMERDAALTQIRSELEVARQTADRQSKQFDQRTEEMQVEFDTKISRLNAELNENQSVFDKTVAELESNAQMLRYELESARQLLADRELAFKNALVESQVSVTALQTRLEEAEAKQRQAQSDLLNKTLHMNQTLHEDQTNRIQDILKLGRKLHELRSKIDQPETPSELESTGEKIFMHLARVDQDRMDAQNELMANFRVLSQQFQEAQQKHAEEIANLSGELKALRPRADEAVRQLEQMRKERDIAIEQLKVETTKARQTAQIKENHSDIEQMKLQLQQREMQLRQYAANVSEEKAEVQTRAKHLADEIRAASSLAPLRDYLSVTEFELKKLETQLRTTPAISIDRPRIEASFKQMVDQREFLKSAIASSEAQLEAQAAQLLKIARPEKLSPVPPPPPRRSIFKLR